MLLAGLDTEARELMIRVAQKLDEACGYIMVTDREYARGFQALSLEVRAAFGLREDYDG